MQSPAPGKDHPKHQHVLGADWLESSFADKDLRVLVDSKLNMSQQCASAAETANRSRAALGRVASRWREVILPFCSALEEPPLQYCVQHWASQYERGMDMLA